MATQIFLKLDGITGGAENPDFADYFDVVSFNFGGSYNFNPATFASTGTHMTHPVSIEIKHDKMLATIYQYFATRTKTEANIVWLQSEDGENANAVDLTLTEAFISGVDSSVSDADGASVEASSNLTLTFKSIIIQTNSARGGDGSEHEIVVTG